MRALPLCCLLALALPRLAAQQWEPLESNTRAELRALYAVDTRVVWAAGKGGVVTHSSDGGRHWTVDSIPGAAGLFLVGVHALDVREAWVAGTAFEGPSLGRIYHTRDGGATWEIEFESSAKGVFLDGLAFRDARHGIAFGDPVEGKAWILTTASGGSRWTLTDSARLPALLPGEASFAASGTAIAVRGQSAWIATGGAPRARVLRSRDGGAHWEASETPATGNSGKGIFGIAPGRKGRLVAVGGDYRDRSASNENLLLSEDGGSTWSVVTSAGLRGVQYGVAHAGSDHFVAVGPTGSAVSRDGGRGWTPLPGDGYNTVSCAKGLCWAGGTGGRLARLRL